MLSLIHCSDVHLDTPMTLSEFRRQDASFAEVRAVFSSMMQYIRTNRIPLLLIAGDLFNNALVSKETILFLKREFSEVPECQIVIAPGADDACTPHSPYLTETFPENVHIFRSAEVTRVSLPALHTDVYGFARCPGEELPGASPLSGFSVADRNAYNIFCAYTALSGDPDAGTDGSAPLVSKEQLVHAGFDYAALGSQHNAGSLRRAVSAGNGTAGASVSYFAYSGCLAGRNFSEPGCKSAIRAVIEKNPGEAASLQVGRLRFSRRHFETLEIDCSAFRNLRQIADAAAAEAENAGYDKETVLRLVLTGSTPPSVLPNEKNLRPLLPHFAELHIEDKTVPDAEAEQLSADPTLRGAFYAELLPLMENGSEEEKETARLALRLGLAALSGSDTE